MVVKNDSELDNKKQNLSEAIYMKISIFKYDWSYITIYVHKPENWKLPLSPSVLPFIKTKWHQALLILYLKCIFSISTFTVTVIQFHQDSPRPLQWCANEAANLITLPSHLPHCWSFSKTPLIVLLSY